MFSFLSLCSVFRGALRVASFCLETALLDASDPALGICVRPWDCVDPSRHMWPHDPLRVSCRTPGTVKTPEKGNLNCTLQICSPEVVFFFSTPALNVSVYSCSQCFCLLLFLSTPALNVSVYSCFCLLLFLFTPALNVSVYSCFRFISVLPWLRWTRSLGLAARPQPIPLLPPRALLW